MLLKLLIVCYVEIGLKVDIEFDPITLMAFFDKMNTLLKNIISYKVRVEHKLITIKTYFDTIAERIDYALNPKEENNNEKYYKAGKE